MKKKIMMALIALSVLVSPAFSSVDPYENWLWTGLTWVYVGPGDPGDPPPPIKE